MELTKKQSEGLRIALERYKNHEKYTVIGGYAGTGKSTLVKFLVEALLDAHPELKKEDFCYTSFTGKACQVLQKKGNDPVYTLHKLLYESIPKPEGGFARKEKDEIEHKIVVCDEVSMVPAEMVKLLLKHNVHVIFCGDPGQLPPIVKDEDNHLLDNPHIFLDEVMRQALESEIVRLSMDIRNGVTNFDEYKNGNEVKIFNHGELSLGMMKWADQILCATNATRGELNQLMRKEAGRGPDPEEGDKVICCRNYWESNGSMGSVLVNGSIGYLDRGYKKLNNIPYWADNAGLKSFYSHHTNIITDYGEKFLGLNLDYNMFSTEKPTLDWKTSYKLNKSIKNSWMVPKEFVYGYAITTHRAQGSEWDKVLVIEEKFPFERDEHAKWLYTAVTRASEKLVLVR